MVKVYTIASGKGGTGKTTVTANLGPMLARYGKKTCILDADVGMANLGLILGLEDLPVTLHEVLAGKARIRDAIYEGPYGVKVVPCGLSLQGFQQSKPERLKDVMADLVSGFDVLILDAPAGISRDGVIPLTIADGVILVVTPEISSIVDSLKTKILTETVGGHVEGAIINRVDGNGDEFNRAQMEEALASGACIIFEDARPACVGGIAHRGEKSGPEASWPKRISADGSSSTDESVPAKRRVHRPACTRPSGQKRDASLLPSPSLTGAAADLRGSPREAALASRPGGSRTRPHPSLHRIARAVPRKFATSGG